MGAAQTAATSLGRQIVVFNASTESELDAAFASVVQQRIGTLLGASKVVVKHAPATKTMKTKAAS